MNKEIEKVPSLKELSDRGAIEYLLKRHSRGIDRLDLDCLLSSYWEDAQVDYGGFKGLAHDFARKVIPSLGQKYKLTQHKISNILVTFNPEVRKALIAASLPPPGPLILTSTVAKPLEIASSTAF